ncbi:zinc-binding alcohol dehydrogenase family protein [Streptomyces luteireticuli]|uniref:quinone oxidoreductase family protein n=1 Tax=Streptomyces luteireticuli TaxID=173858 RepID=UPI0035573194
MRAITMREFGGPEVLEPAEVDEPSSREGHIVVEVTHAGVNWADLHVRENSYLAPVRLPYVPGNEIAGITADGRRVTALISGGGYAERALAPEGAIWEIPDDITDEQALALTLQGNTAWHAIFTCTQLMPGETIVIPAAAGGVGVLAVQLAKLAGARVVAMASSESSRALALEMGADAVVDSSVTEQLSRRIRQAADGPVHAALEMTGGPTLVETMNALAPRGRMVVYGYASGKVTDIPTQAMLQRSINVSGMWLPRLFSNGSTLAVSMKALYAAVRSGDLKTVSGGTYPLDEARKAHEALENRSHVGKLCLTIGQ